MFKIHAAQPAHFAGSNHASTSYGASSSKGKDRMELDLDEDPAMLSNSEARVAIPGESIASAQNWMRGHGTYVEEEAVVSSVSGLVERVNKLVSVRALRAKYRPEIGDLVIGRISEVGPKRWRVECKGKQDGVLMLSSINLPGGVQRRKLESDELQMRTFFQEGDLLVAEVQSILGEGTMSLHTRSLKYGKLRNGRLVTVPSSLIVRLKSHFHSLPFGVDLILGMNGLIWVSTPSSISVSSAANGASDPTMEDERGEASASMAIYSSTNDPIAPETAYIIDRVVKCIEILAEGMISISDASVVAAYQACAEVARQLDDTEQMGVEDDVDLAVLDRREVRDAIRLSVREGS